MLDLIIIGAGPAGITASVYAARKMLSFMVITMDIGGQTAWSGGIENYTGYQFITGPDLAARFEEHMRTFNILVHEQESVTLVKKEGNKIIVTSDKGVYESKAVIITAGKKSRELGVPGEKEFKNRGVTYCATCDGPLFSGKDVAVIGGGNSALDAAIQLKKIGRSVVMINIAPQLGGDSVMQQNIAAASNVKVLNNTRVTEIRGEKFVNTVQVEHEGRRDVLNVQGVFIEIGLVPNAQCAPQLHKNELGEIIVNNKNETNIPGIFAAGDVTDVPEKQIIVAAGEGAKAALSAFHYLVQSPGSTYY